jgi:RNA polymerase sigma-70 factor (ECF subfamily)
MPSPPISCAIVSAGARHSQVSLDATGPACGTAPRESLPGKSPAPGAALQSAERGEQICRAVAALPEELQTPFIIFEYEERPQAEIAEILGCSPKSVEMRLCRARQALRAALEALLAKF